MCLQTQSNPCRCQGRDALVGEQVFAGNIAGTRQGKRSAGETCRRLICFVALFLFAASIHAAEGTVATVIEMEGTVEVSQAGTATWSSAITNQALAAGDQVRTGERSRAVVRVSDKTLKRLGELSLYQVQPGGRSKLLRGLLYFFHRDKPGTFPIETPSAYAVIIGTEFSLEVAGNNATTLHLIDGRVEMTNDFGRVDLVSGQSALAEPGQPPRPTAALQATNIIQWALYYPGVLDPDELRLGAAEPPALAPSLAAYRKGDLLAALANYPAGRQPGSDAERVYFAALLLAVGKVDEAVNQLNGLKEARGLNRELAAALQTVIAAVKFQPDHTDPTSQPSPRAAEREKTNDRPAPNPQLSTVLLAESYFAQSRADLEPALDFARRAAAVAPNFGFAWARVAELEFSFGRVDFAEEAVEKALRLSPHNAQAWVVKGFLSAAANRLREATRYFDQAIALDGALGNAWLGRGLCRLRVGDREGGRQDLQTAVVVEPQRAVLRSYLGKAFDDARDNAAAGHELRRAREFDPNDPTAWLYSALLNRRQNRINEAVRDLQRSEDLNNNRRVYRSALLLDQDRAVRGVNLASAFADAGLAELARREAGRAVDSDPANYSAHLFLGNSYQAQRDLKGVNQRFETPAVTEYLLANLLSPVGAGTLAQSVSQQEYSKLFEADGLGLASSTEYFSNGRWVEQGAQYGTFGNFSYALSAYYNTDNGQRPNNELEQTELSVQVKQQLTAKDSVYLRAVRSEAEGGDLVPRYYPTNANRGFQFNEAQEPLLLAGYHREWSPGVHSLLLGGWFNDEVRVKNPQQDVLLLSRDPGSVIIEVIPCTIAQRYRNDVEFFSTEAQQIWQAGGATLVAGGRFQAGDLHTRNQHTNAVVPPGVPPFVSGLFPNQPENVTTEFSRWSAYGYGYLRPIDSLQLVAGLSYDRLSFPSNFRFAPLSGAEEDDEQLSPKVGLVWTPLKRTTLRAAYSKSLGGVGFEQSIRLEPTQVAGFNQMFRSLMPESVTGANIDEPFESFNLSLEQQFGSGTFVAVGGELLRSEVSRQLGVYNYDNATITIAPGWTEQKLDYHEGALTATFNQLVGNEWAFGALYRVSVANLESRFTEIPSTATPVAGFQARTELEAVLHHVNLFAIYNHPSGLFGQLQSLWYAQSNRKDVASLPGDDFWQLNLVAGYRFLHRRAEVSVGVLNITSQDYRLNPLNLTPELPRQRTLTAGLKLNF